MEKIKIFEPKVIHDGDKVYMNDNGFLVTNFIQNKFVGYAYCRIKYEENILFVSKYPLKILQKNKNERNKNE